MKQKQPVTLETWKIMIRRYLIVAITGLVLCIIFFWLLAHRHIDEVPSPWVLVGTAVSGVMLLGGIFGMALNYFLYMLHKEG